MAKIGWDKILAGVATAAAAGAAYVYLKQRAAKAPIYQVLGADGAFEIRRYPALLAIQADQSGSRDRALGNGFGLLASYMFGEGREGDEIPITMPVVAQPLNQGGWRISFLLPENQLRDSLEAPGQGVVIGEIPAREIAVIAVPGKPTDRLFAGRAAELQRWVKARSRLSSAAAEHAYYTSPLEPDSTRANEIWLPLKSE